ncbi:MAG: GxxExxY protein [Chloroflexota bacterium]
MDIEEIAKTIVDSAIKVHRELGPGLLESAYQKCLAYELSKRGLDVQCEVEAPIVYDGQMFDVGYRIDMLVEKSIIIENKTVDQFAPIHQVILLTYLRMRGLQLGFLLNWKTLLMINGIKRMVNTPGYSSRKLQKLLLIFFVFFASLRLMKEILWRQY